MKLALEQLGLGRCHHMKEVLPDSEQLEFWRKAAMGETADWDEIFEGFGCSTDWRSAFFWRELAAHYPQAKILLIGGERPGQLNVHRRVRRDGPCGHIRVPEPQVGRRLCCLIDPVQRPVDHLQ